jgi:hypothetical protein
MAYAFTSLEEALDDLPTLKKVLGPEWIEREHKTPALWSDFSLARTLRIPELRNLVVSLDRSLQELWNVEGASDWRNRLRHNGQEFRAVLAETSFAMLLLRKGRKFTHPKGDAPDFAVLIDDSPPITIEVTTPHSTVWADDLQGRLWVLSRQYGYCLRSEPITNESPILDEEIDQVLMLQITRDSEEVLKNATSEDSPLERLWDSIGLKLIWTPCEYPTIRGTNSPGSARRRAFDYIGTAAEKKAAQMEKGGAHTLVIGRNMLPFPEFEIYVHSLRNNVPYHGQFDWARIPDQVTCIVLFMATYDEAKLPAVDMLIRPVEGQSAPEGFDRVLEDLNQAHNEQRQQEVEETSEFIKQMTRYEAKQRENDCNENE